MNLIELHRLLSNLLRVGTIASVDAGAARCRVRIGDITTAALPWLAQRAGEAATWSAPTVGEQVLVLSPGGDLSLGLVLPGLYQGTHPAPGSEAGLHRFIAADGAVLEYQESTSTLRATLPGSGRAELVAPGGISITGNVEIAGDVAITGSLNATVQVEAAGIKLTSHRHGQVAGGSSTSGPPQ